MTPRQIDYASKSENAAKSLLGLLNDILDFSKIEAGKMALDRQPFRLDRLMRDLAVVLSANAASKSIEVLYDIDPAIPDVLLGDAMRLQQILINLSGNAIKFTSQGQVVLSLHLTQPLEATSQEACINFAVQDSGIGIAPENQAHIFSGFSQAEASTTRRFGGTGLGLSISKQFIELMGGKIQITSALGVGSTFEFTLKLPLVKPIPVELQTHQHVPVEPKRVLVIDDNALSCELMAHIVRAWGWHADVATGGQQALDLIGTHPRDVFPYQIVYLDWHMPDMDGWETARQIRQLCQENGTVAPQIIMVTAHGRESLAQRTQQEQALINGFLVKPVTASMLLDAVMDAGHEEARMRQNLRSSQRQLEGLRILVVEDNLINQQVAEELLNSEGALVSIASNGRLGVNAVAAANPQYHAVLMDIQMPVMDGYAATRVIRQELGLTRLPIIGLTANAMASDREACLQAGMNEHMGKPFDLAKLVSMLIRLTI
jgi:CheY-like chemotaxis protein